MVESFLIIINQVAVLFILIAIGFLLRKVNLLEEKAVKGITNVVLYAVTPCVIIRSFNREMNVELLKGLLLTFAVSILSYIFIIVLTNFIVKDNDDSRRRIYRFAIIFSNTGFMGIPIYQAVLGDIGVFYGSAYIAMFNVFCWTYGYMMMDGKSKSFDIKKAIVNPGVLSTIIGVIIFIAGIRVPAILEVPMADMAALNTPLPMLVIGYFLAGIALSDFKDAKQIAVSTRGTANGTFVVRDEREGNVVAKITIAPSKEWAEFGAPIAIEAGKHPLYFTYEGEGAADFFSFTLS